MPENVRVIVEVAFNISYLLVVWGLVAVMTLRRAEVAPQDRKLASRVRWAFALLALGDTGHVGFRVVAYALGGLEANPVLVGMGAMSTAFTVTVFYMLVLDMWRIRFNRSLGVAGWLLLAAGVVRLVIMTLPQNQWQLVVPPYGFSLLRNAFLVIQGLGVLALILRDAGPVKDRTFQWIGAMIILSFAFYTPVILWVGAIPLLGMLMIPKTLAYIGVAVIAYRALYPRLRKQTISAAEASASD